MVIEPAQGAFVGVLIALIMQLFLVGYVIKLRYKGLEERFLKQVMKLLSRIDELEEKLKERGKNDKSHGSIEEDLPKSRSD